MAVPAVATGLDLWVEHPERGGVVQSPFSALGHVLAFIYAFLFHREGLNAFKSSDFPSPSVSIMLNTCHAVWSRVYPLWIVAYGDGASSPYSLHRASQTERNEPRFA